MNKKRLLILGIVVSLVISMMSGCGEKKTETDGEGLPTVKWYNYGPQVRELDLVFDEVSKYTSEKIGVNVECVNMPGSEFAQKMNMIFASKESFDMCFTSAGQNFYQNASKNCFLPVDTLLQDYAKDILEIVPYEMFKSATVNGKIYAVPAYKDNAYEYSIGYNLKYAEDIGFDPTTVKSLYDIEPALESFKQKYPNEYPLGVYSKYSFYPMLGYISLGNGIAVDIYDDSGKVLNPWEQDRTKEFFAKMHEWYKKGYIVKDAATRIDTAGMGNTFISIAQMLPYQRQVSNQNSDDSEKMGDINILEPWITGAAGSMVAISKTSKNPEKTMEFINLLNTDEYLRNLVAYGIENKHYVAVGDNHFKYPEGVETRDDNSYFSYPYTQGNMFITRTIEGTPDDIWDKYKEFDNSAIKASNYGFTFDITPVKSEVASVSNVISEYASSLETGSVDPDVFLPQALKKLKDAGIDTVIAEAQRQLDEFRK